MSGSGKVRVEPEILIQVWVKISIGKPELKQVNTNSFRALDLSSTTITSFFSCWTGPDRSFLEYFTLK